MCFERHDGNGKFSSEEECQQSCDSATQEPNWAIGSVESNPRTHVMSNVGNTGKYIQNYMGSQQQNTYYHTN
jgi:hypothetical protein